MAAAAVSQIGQFEAEMSSDSFQLLGMAERGFLPAALAKRSRYDTPTIGIILSSLGILTLVTFNFTQVWSSNHHTMHTDFAPFPHFHKDSLGHYAVVQGLPSRSIHSTDCFQDSHRALQRSLSKATLV